MHGLPDAERVADGERVVADRQRVGIAELQRDEIVRLDLEQRDVGAGIGADELRGELPAVLQGDQDLAGIADDVMVRDHVALLRVDDHAGAGARLGLTALGHVEVAPEERILEERVLRFPAARQHGDVHDGRRHALEQRRERGDLAVDGDRRNAGVGRRDGTCEQQHGEQAHGAQRASGHPGPHACTAARVAALR